MAGETSAAAAVVVDALPYIDHGFSEPGVREAALALVEEEMRRYRPTRNYLSHLPPAPPAPSAADSRLTPLLRAEQERLAARQPLDSLSMRRYELPPPPAAKQTDVAAWSECVDNSAAQLQHQSTRLDNLQLMAQLAPAVWRRHNQLTAAQLQQCQQQLQLVKQQVQQVNWARKQAQLAAGEQLQQLETSWVTLVSKNYDIEQVCAQLETQVLQLKEELQQAQEQQQQQQQQAE